MIDVRTLHAIAVVLNGLAAGAAAQRHPGVAVALIVLSSSLLIWSLERLRVAVAREPRS